jgi:hypothetical protein
MITFLADLLIGRAKRTPYEHLADYMQRFWVREHNEAKSNIAARVHNIKRSDYDRALHDHPWWNISFVLKGGYWEVVPGIYQQAREVDFAGVTARFLELHELVHAVGGKGTTRQQRRELLAMGILWRGPGALVRRRAEALHRLIVPKGAEAWSLFVMGPKVREWGFAAPTGWVHNVEYTAALGRDT